MVDRLPTPDMCAELDALGVATLVTSAWLMAGLKFAPLEANIEALQAFGRDYIAPLTAST